MTSIAPDAGIRGKRVLLTGASRGIGAAAARLFADLGARVGVHCRSASPAAEAVSAACPGSRVFPADLSRPFEAAPLVDSFAEWAGGLDILVNNAGGVPADPAAIRALNLDSPLVLIERAWPHLVAAGSGCVVNVSSAVAGRAASTRLANYAIAKAGLEQATRNFALAGASHGIRVNAVRPGIVDTELNRWADDPDRTKFAARSALVPIGRAAQSGEVAAAILFLSGAMSGYVTGSILTIAGGE